MPLAEKLAPVPRHVAIIMDGNNRWARANKLKAVAAGHQAGMEAIRGVLEACQNLGVDVLTLFAFSSENWKRSKTEVDALMKLFSRYLRSELKQLQDNQTRLRFIGRRDRFSAALQQQMKDVEQATAGNQRGTLVIAADYGGQWDIVQAARKLGEEVKAGKRKVSELNPELLGEYISIADLPEPDLLVRTGGEHRISNFLLWQCAYTEFYFTDTYWPDFKAVDLQAAVHEYQLRERRFGKTSDQVARSPHA
jgi:undecaprenyl diphosphate synthase